MGAHRRTRPLNEGKAGSFRRLAELTSLADELTFLYFGVILGPVHRRAPQSGQELPLQNPGRVHRRGPCSVAAQVLRRRLKRRSRPFR